MSNTQLTSFTIIEDNFFDYAIIHQECLCQGLEDRKHFSKVKKNCMIYVLQIEFKMFCLAGYNITYPYKNTRIK
jgi:hypothetical protein